jgi:hypothetical protein
VQRFGGKNGKYVPPPPPPPVLPRLWPKEKNSEEEKDSVPSGEKGDQGVALEDKIANIKAALKEFHTDL